MMWDPTCVFILKNTVISRPELSSLRSWALKKLELEYECSEGLRLF